MREVEAKFRVDADFAVPPLAAEGAPVASIGAPHRLLLRAQYHDTADLRLARWGVTLRQRSGGDDDGWHLKLPLGPPGERDELAAEADGPTPPAELRRLVTAFLRGARLRRVARLDTDRTVYPLLGPSGEHVGELVDDVVSVRDAGRIVATFRELEVEVAPETDPPALLRHATTVLTAAGAVAGEFQPKAVRALGPRASEPPVPAPPGELSRDASAAAVVTAYLREQARALLVQDVRVRRDLPDSVHQMRVAARRLRSGLRSFGPLVEPEWAAALGGELRWIAGELAEVRDREVMLGRLVGHLDALPPDAGQGTARRTITSHYTAELAAGRDRVLSALGSRRYLRLLDDLVDGASSPRLTDAAAAPAAGTLAPLVTQAWEKLAKKARRLDERSPDQALHQVRIAAKRARYAAEAAAAVFGKPAKAFGRALANVQEVLGEHHDAVVAAEVIRELAAGRRTPSRVVFTLGALHAHEHAAAERARAGFPAAWKAASRPALRRWL